MKQPLKSALLNLSLLTKMGEFCIVGQTSQRQYDVNYYSTITYMLHTLPEKTLKPMVVQSQGVRNDYIYCLANDREFK